MSSLWLRYAISAWSHNSGRCLQVAPEEPDHHINKGHALKALKRMVRHARAHHTHTRPALTRVRTMQHAANAPQRTYRGGAGAAGAGAGT